jgi:hypothetical protein
MGEQRYSFPLGLNRFVDPLAGVGTMSNKEQHGNKETKKKSALSPKEKKAAKRAKKQNKS